MLALFRGDLLRHRHMEKKACKWVSASDPPATRPLYNIPPPHYAPLVSLLGEEL